MDICQFDATLYFMDRPTWTREALVASWFRAGYTCEDDDPDKTRDDEVFSGLRGGTYVVVSEAIDKIDDELPTEYPHIAKLGIDYDQTYLINHRKALLCFQEARYQADVMLRVEANPEHPKIAHNEWVTTLLGIHQVAPIHALAFHDLEILVGADDLNENLNYANDQLDEPPQFTPMMAFGTLFSEIDGLRRGWTTGLPHFGHPDLLVESRTRGFMDLSRAIFNVGHMVTSGWAFKAGETGEVGELFFEIGEAQVDDRNVLLLKLRDEVLPPP